LAVHENSKLRSSNKIFNTSPCFAIIDFTIHRDNK
jgi:hypothetical protein